MHVGMPTAPVRLHAMVLGHIRHICLLYEAYSESKYRFAVKNRLRTKFYCYQILHSSNYFSNAAIIEALIVAGHTFLYTLLIECGRR